MDVKKFKILREMYPTESRNAVVEELLDEIEMLYGRMLKMRQKKSNCRTVTNSSSEKSGSIMHSTTSNTVQTISRLSATRENGG